MIWQFIIGNRVVRLIGGALVAILSGLTFGALKKREGRQAAKSEARVKELEAYVETSKTLDAVVRSTDAAAARARMRTRNAGKSGGVLPKERSGD